MKQDIILAGVGGQGILSIAFVMDIAALQKGWQFKQAEVHGMAQRGGAVQSHLRISTETIFSDLIPRGQADMILSVEPLETLRYLNYLNPEGFIISNCVPYTNIPDYPPMEKVLEKIKQSPRVKLLDAPSLAHQAGSSLTQNMVMLGAASTELIIEESYLKEGIKQLFKTKGEQIVAMNLKAFDLGRQAALQINQ
ncbi:MAG TPA: indolepyruvate oxidoreductase subunit beta [Candidatus Aminicenantes bacterium]|nr:indolepyruvate oxidoreductase subunit beta [Candidatus Aminicenantes bacterium]